MPVGSQKAPRNSCSGGAAEETAGTSKRRRSPSNPETKIGARRPRGRCMAAEEVVVRVRATNLPARHFAVYAGAPLKSRYPRTSALCGLLSSLSRDFCIKAEEAKSKTPQLGEA
jgi:hypothetical protein